MFYLINLIYTRPLEEVQLKTDEHRQYLTELRNKGIIIMAGPKNPRNGGVIIAKGDKKAIDQLIHNDPYFIYQLASYDITEFNPVIHQSSLDKLF